MYNIIRNVFYVPSKIAARWRIHHVRVRKKRSPYGGGDERKGRKGRLCTPSKHNII